MKEHNHNHHEAELACFFASAWPSVVKAMRLSSFSFSNSCNLTFSFLSSISDD